MQYTVFLVLAPVTAFILVATIALAVKSRSSRISRPLVASLISSLAFVILNTLELFWPTEAGTMLFAKLGYYRI